MLALLRRIARRRRLLGWVAALLLGVLPTAIPELAAEALAGLVSDASADEDGCCPGPCDECSCCSHVRGFALERVGLPSPLLGAGWPSPEPAPLLGLGHASSPFRPPAA